MTYNVFGGTVNPTLLLLWKHVDDSVQEIRVPSRHSWNCLKLCDSTILTRTQRLLYMVSKLCILLFAEYCLCALRQWHTSWEFAFTGKSNFYYQCRLRRSPCVKPFEAVCLFVCQLCTRFAVRRPSNLADMTTCGLSISQPGDLDLWCWNGCTLLTVGWATFLPIVVFLWLFVLDLWVNNCQTHHVTSRRPWPLTLVVTALVSDTGLRTPSVYQVWSP